VVIVVLAVGRVEVLLPQPGAGRVRGVRVDGLVVVAADDGVFRHVDLPVDALGLELVDLRGLQVIPVEDDGGLPGLDRRRGGVDRQEVARGRELLEVVHPRRDVVGGTAVGDRRMSTPL